MYSREARNAETYLKAINAALECMIQDSRTEDAYAWMGQNRQALLRLEAEAWSLFRSVDKLRTRS